MVTLITKDQFAAAAFLKDDELIASTEPAAVFEEERLRVGIFDGTQECSGCGNLLHWICIEFYADGGYWNPVLTVQEQNFPKMMSLFERVNDRLTDRC